jgi:hypothetical protein
MNKRADLPFSESGVVSGEEFTDVVSVAGLAVCRSLFISGLSGDVLHDRLSIRHS